MPDYPFAEIESKWQGYWETHRTFATTEDLTKPKYYVLDMFPYPSAAGLHVGHPEGYTATDIVARYKRMLGFNVLHTIGWDAFGLPAEQYALRTGVHPAVTTKRNIDNFRRQIKMLGLSYDWDREISTTHPDYYKWTQWIFLKLYNMGLAYLGDFPVNWCPEVGIVLADEEVPEQLEKGYTVERRKMRQWMLRITAYAERLLDDLDGLDWPENIKQMQRNWIGRSEGVKFCFDTESGDKVEVFTTRPDTLFGATFLVLAPEHPLVDQLTTASALPAVEAYIGQSRLKSDLERTELAKEKTGAFTGAYAINPANGDRIPIWIADYVLVSYGTGAIMCVPSDDDRDREFALKYGLPIVEIAQGGVPIKPDSVQRTGSVAMKFVSSDGLLALDGEDIEDAKAKVIAWLEATERGSRTVAYKMRDWLFSRQRFWGEPFPIVYDTDGNHRPLPESELPLKLPEVESYQFSGSGESPLATISDWVETVDTVTGNPLRRETNTMPQWAGSSWYYLRFIDPRNEQELISKEKEKYWMPVDLYIGGAEHAVLHLLYARFWHKVLYDLGIVSTKEPFQKLFNQGMILGYTYRCFRDEGGPVALGDVEWISESQTSVPIHKLSRRTLHMVVIPPEEVRWVGDEATHSETGELLEVKREKMSKSLGNVVNPDEVVQKFGADCMRLYEMFMGPLDQEKAWNTQSIEGVARFLSRSWKLVTRHATSNAEHEPSEDVARALHRATKKVTGDIDALRFNTAVAHLMELLGVLRKETCLSRGTLERFVLLLSPFAPHLCEELWERLGHGETLAYQPWPDLDENLAREELVTSVFQVNGRVRGRATVSIDVTKAELLDLAMVDEGVQRHLHGCTILATHVVVPKVVNFEVTTEFGRAGG